RSRNLRFGRDPAAVEPAVPQSRAVVWPPVIRLQSVTKVYPTSARPALDNVTVEIEKGEFVFLVGQSGSGKSTFLRLVLREEKVTRGSIWVAGKDLNKLSNWKVP